MTADIPNPDPCEPTDRFIIPTDDASVTRRVKGLVITRPIHDLERNKPSYPGDHWDNYDLVALAVNVIDAVALAMGVSTGLTHTETLAACTAEASRQQPAAAGTEHELVAERVLGALISDTPHTHTYIDVTGDGGIRHYEYQLLYEEYRADGTVTVRAKPEAINVLVDALDLDVTSAQIASEAQMRVLIERGALHSAAAVANKARYQTIQYLEQIRNVIRDTLIDPDSVDWADTIPKFLDGALDHIDERLAAELELRGAVETQRASTDDGDIRLKANQLIARLKDCTARHTELQRHLLSVRTNLRQAQDDRFARPTTTTSRITFDRDILPAMLARPPAQLAGWVDNLVAKFTAPATPFWPSLATLVDELADSPPETASGTEIEDTDFVDDDIEPWWVQYWDTADDIINAVGDPVDLHALCAQAANVADSGVDTDTGEPLERGALIAAVIHRAYERTAVSLTASQPGDVIICAAGDGQLLDTGDVTGDGIVVCSTAFQPDQKTTTSAWDDIIGDNQ